MCLYVCVYESMYVCKVVAVATTIIVHTITQRLKRDVYWELLVSSVRRRKKLKLLAG